MLLHADAPPPRYEHGYAERYAAAIFRFVFRLLMPLDADDEAPRHTLRRRYAISPRDLRRHIRSLMLLLPLLRCRCLLLHAAALRLLPAPMRLFHATDAIFTCFRAAYRLLLMLPLLARYAMLR